MRIENNLKETAKIKLCQYFSLLKSPNLCSAYSLFTDVNSITTDKGTSMIIDRLAIVQTVEIFFSKSTDHTKN